MTSPDDLPECPADLYLPPERIEASPPVSTRPSSLPLGDLSWETFERLCLRLAAQRADTRFAKLYGRRGQKQHGIDLYVRRGTGRYSVWQAKRYETFTASHVSKAVEVFLAGPWVGLTDEVTLCVKASLHDTKVQDEIERQSRVLASQDIDLVALDGEGLSERLRAHPEIVDDFFGRAWVQAFCGDDAARTLTDRLEAAEAQELRRALRHLYRCHFDIWDSGAHLPIVSHDGLPRHLPLVERYIEADVFEATRITTGYGGTTQERDASAWIPEGEGHGDRRRPVVSKFQTELVKRRAPVFAWLANQARSLILGDAGSGKSTLLRVLALEILAEEPRRPSVQARWAGALPIWLPFSFWTESIACERGERSLPATLRAYLNELAAPPRLWELVEQALRDRRLLLLVDGLDEWTNEQAGHTAVALLRAFVEQHGIAAIVTSRPLGFQRLGGLDDRWQLVDLAPLSQAQQEELTDRWLRHADNREQAPAHPQTGSSVRTRAAAFVAELNRHPSLARLAGIPLLLWGLIALRLSQAQLPRNRFAAYEKLTSLLLHEHPAKRREAALSRGRGDSLSPDTQDEALARLAFSALDRGEETALEIQQAKQTLMDFLQAHLDYPRHECAACIDSLLEVGADAASLLIRKSSRHLGFLHRAFMEFLAARHIARLDLDRQREIVRERFRDPRWLDTLLAVLHLTRRPNDIALLVSEVESAAADPISAPLKQRLLAEVAFGAFQLPAKTAKRLAEEAYTQIEAGTWMPLRRAILSLAVDGLQSDSLRSSVQRRMRRWFPNRRRFRSSIYDAVATWPAEPETLQCLWEGLFACEGADRRSAAIALTKVFGGDPGGEARIKRLLRTPVEPDLHRVALEALALGWPKSLGIERAIAEARASVYPDLRLVAIRAVIAAGQHNEADRDELLALGAGGSDLSYELRDDLADALVSGWPGDGLVKARCLETWENRFGYYREEIEHDIAARVLLKGFGSDLAVIERLACLFENEHGPFTIAHEAMQLLPHIFPSANRHLESAIEQWIAKQKFRSSNICWASLAIRSNAAKGGLLERLRQRDTTGFWYARALLDGWGMKDPEVAARLTEIARQTGLEALPAAPRIADILPDRQECRRRLLELAVHPETLRHFNLISTGFRRLGIPQDDEEVKALFLDKALQGPRDYWSSDLGTLMRFFPHDERVRQLAKKELQQADDIDYVYAVAAAYAQDAEIRKELVESLSPLPTELRVSLVERMARIAQDEAFAEQELSRYGDECEERVRSAAVIGYCETLATYDIAPEAVIEKLRDGLHAVGFDSDARRRAAFSGLLALDRLDIFLGEKNHHDGSPLKLRLRQGWRDDAATLRLVAHRWDRLQARFSESD